MNLRPNIERELNDLAKELGINPDEVLRRFFLLLGKPKYLDFLSDLYYWQEIEEKTPTFTLTVDENGEILEEFSTEPRIGMN